MERILRHGQNDYNWSKLRYFILSRDAPNYVRQPRDPERRIAKR